MNFLLKIGLGFLAFLFMLSLWSSCSTGRSGNSYNISVSTASADAASGLDLRAVGELLKSTATGADLERKLNDKATGINNLDLDEDGAVDYLKVTEYGQPPVKGFSLTVDLAGGETQEVATIEIEKTADGNANIQTRGNSSIYGNNHYYHHRTSLTDVLLIGWLFSANRPFYSSPYGYNSYPGGYSRYAPTSYDRYRDRTRSVRSSTAWNQSNRSTLSNTPTSPNAGKTASNIKAPLKNPTASQKSFQTRNPSKTVRSGGFGSKSSPSVRSSSSSSFRSGGK